jgi:transcriptional regulator with XRE-family HTH domain
MPAKAKISPRSTTREDELIGQRMKLRRTELDISQSELSAALKPPITFQQIQKYEQGASRIACATAIQISKILKIDLNELLGVKSVVKEVAIDPMAYELGLEFQKLSPPTRIALLKVARALIESGHSLH